VSTLYKAITNKDLAEVKRLIAAGTDVNDYAGYRMTPLDRAAIDGQTEMVRLLLAAKADPDLQDREDGCTPLIDAACYDQMDIVRLLLEAGAQTETLNKAGKTALMVAKEKGHLGIASLLSLNRLKRPLYGKTGEKTVRRESALGEYRLTEFFNFAEGSYTSVMEYPDGSQSHTRGALASAPPRLVQAASQELSKLGGNPYGGGNPPSAVTTPPRVF
jgi:hypothetical protein